VQRAGDLCGGGRSGQLFLERRSFDRTAVEDAMTIAVRGDRDAFLWVSA
jgi:hypothetical protein